MKVLVIFDSQYGNTAQIAKAIGGAFEPLAQVQTLPFGDVQPENLEGHAILVMGSPTQRFRPTGGLSDFLKKIPRKSLAGAAVAAFDTRLLLDEIDSSALRFVVKTGGYAASSIADRLKKSGGKLVVPPEGFFVLDMEGPLKEGELERAAGWARQIYAAVSSPESAA